VLVEALQAANNRISVARDHHIGEISVWISKVPAKVIKEVANQTKDYANRIEHYLRHQMLL